MTRQIAAQRPQERSRPPGGTGIPAGSVVAAEQSGQAGVYLRADQRADYGQVVRVLAIMRAAGVGDVGLVTEPEDVDR